VASPAPSTRVPEVSFLEFRERAGLDRLRVPLEGTIETTYRCNLNCVHCYVNQPAGSREERERELSLERLKQLNVESRENTPAEFRAFVVAEIEKWSGVVREANIKLG